MNLDMPTFANEVDLREGIIAEIAARPDKKTNQLVERICHRRAQQLA